MTEPIYAIPDIHGQDALLDEALERIEADGGPGARVIFLGDLVDRGSDSRAVIERLMAGQAEGRDWTVLRGNHDQLFLDFLDHGTIHSPRILSGKSWLHPRLGGAGTLASYGVRASEGAPAWSEARAAVPRAHRDWLARLPYWHDTGEMLFVHAGIRPGLPLSGQDPADLLWIRDGFLDHVGPHPWLVVHGHTALDHPTHFGNRIDLDGGAAYGRPLWPAVFEGRDCWLLSETGRMPLAPS
ncbi:metallophosphoesterase family protein [Roseovarius autotrophicus]|uniref:metallophosphoesterase family protein n=1 Tax=Roseovarius autotrophicus TaxID=2824121 RepID=UPI0019F7A95C|nr:metallophosphoesterase family protein [Roseovarius autotrophicus]MBE0455459.1 serine/threonine protein phosphatase [Roseovarius sp.]